MSGDDCVARHSRQRAPGQMARAAVQLIIPDTLDDDLVETDPRYAKPRYRRTHSDAAARERDAIGDPLARRGDRAPRLLCLPLLPREISLIHASRVLQAGMTDQHRSRDAKAD